MAYSGRCFLSKYFVNRSANQGDCIQPCRWEYDISPLDKGGVGGFCREITPQTPLIRGAILIKPKGKEEHLELVEEEHGSYILNSQDLCLIKKLPELIDAGINSFKIEGRAKSVYYLACVVGAYRRAIDEVIKSKVRKVKSQGSKILNNLFKELNDKLYHRGYTEGFMFENGKLAQNLENSHKVPNWEFCGQVVNKKNKNKKKNKRYNIYVKAHNALKAGDNIEIVMPGYDIIKMKVKKMLDAETGAEIKEAHGGQEKTIILESEKFLPEFSVVRRKIKHNANAAN
jgi:putative protease